MSRKRWPAPAAESADEMMCMVPQSATGSDADAVYVFASPYVVGGSDFRSADPGTDQNGRATSASP